MARSFLATARGWILVLGCGLSMATRAQSAPPGDSVSPDEIQVKLAWLADRDTFACILGVHVKPTGLEICGRVPSEKVHQEALALAQSHTTMRIEDRLEVSQRMIRRQVREASPEVLQLKATALLQKAMAERAQHLRVTGADNGVVVVNGKVRSLEEKLQVSQELWLLNCCACVLNQVEVSAEVALVPRIAEHAPLPVALPVSPSPEKAPAVEGVAVLQLVPGVGGGKEMCVPPEVKGAPKPVMSMPPPVSSPAVPAAIAEGTHDILAPLPVQAKATLPVGPPPADRRSGAITTVGFSSAPLAPPSPKPPAPQRLDLIPPAPSPLPAQVKVEAIPLPPVPSPTPAVTQPLRPEREAVTAAAFVQESTAPQLAASEPLPRNQTPAVLPAAVAATPLPDQTESKSPSARPAVASDPTELKQWSTWAILVALGSLGVALGVVLALAWMRRNLAKLTAKAPENKPAPTVLNSSAPAKAPASAAEPTTNLHAPVVPAPVHDPEPAPVASPPAELPRLESVAAKTSPAREPAEPLPLPAVISVTNKPEPGVSVRWEGPQTVRLGQLVACRICAKNVSAQVARQVVVRHELADGVAIQGSEPAATREGSWLSWLLGTLQPGEERRIHLQLLPQSRGELNCEALVSFTGSSTLRLRVHEPHLALQVAALDKVLLGQTATILLTVSNTGDGSAEDIQVKADLGQGLEHAGERQVTLEIGSLAPHESRSIQLLCTARAGGSQACTIEARADGAEPVRATATVEVLLPQLVLAVSGPKRRYIDRHATYTIRVSNAGSAPASTVTVTHRLTAGVRFHAASAGGRHDEAAGTVSWFLGDLLSGQSREVSLTVVAATAGACRLRTTAQGIGGLRAECETVTLIEGLSALQMEVINLEDPVEVGAETVYEVRVCNAGSRAEAGLELTCTLPPGMEFCGALCEAGAGFVLQGRDIAFEPLAELAPREQTIYRVRVRGQQAGDWRFLARLTAKDLSEPVVREKTTKVYADEVVAS